MNGDANVTALDALMVINQLGRGEFDQSLDANEDDAITALDALNIINQIEKGSERIESAASDLSEVLVSEQLRDDSKLAIDHVMADL